MKTGKQKRTRTRVAAGRAIRCLGISALLVGAERGEDANVAISHLSATGSDLLHRAFALAFGLVAFTVMIVFLAAVGCRALSVRMSAGRAVEPATVR